MKKLMSLENFKGKKIEASQCKLLYGGKVVTSKTVTRSETVPSDKGCSDETTYTQTTFDDGTSVSCTSHQSCCMD